MKRILISLIHFVLTNSFLIDSSSYYKHQANYKIRFKGNLVSDKDRLLMYNSNSDRNYKSSFHTHKVVPMKRSESNMNALPVPSTKGYKHQF
jgi:hypothetical protein